MALGRQRQPPFARGPFLDFRGRRARTEARWRATTCGPPRATRRPLAALSGGNQQKVVVARELDGRPPAVLVAVQPTRGLDIGGGGARCARGCARPSLARRRCPLVLDGSGRGARAGRSALRASTGGRVTGAFGRRGLRRPGDRAAACSAPARRGAPHRVSGFGAVLPSLARPSRSRSRWASSPSTLTDVTWRRRPRPTRRCWLRRHRRPARIPRGQSRHGADPPPGARPAPRLRCSRSPGSRWRWPSAWGCSTSARRAR